MKKITLLCLDSHRESALDELRKLGVLHIEHVNESPSADLEQSRDRLTRAQAALAELPPLPDSKTGHATAATIAPGAAVDDIAALIQRRRAIDERNGAALAEKVRLLPLGDFDPGLIDSLAQAGITVKLYRAPRKQTIDIPKNAVFQALGQDKAMQYMAVAGHAEAGMDAEEIPIPTRSLADVVAELESLAKERTDIERQLHDLANAATAIKKHIAALTEDATYLEARDGMGLSGRVAYLQGYCPENMVDALRKASAAHGWGLRITQPAETDDPPTLIRYPRFVKPIKAVFDGLGILPGYREADISVAFLIFFSVFFGMLIGDAGYGVLFLCLNIWLSAKFRKAPRYPFTLFGILSVCAIVWGLLTGNVFGVQGDALPALLQAMSIPWLTNAETGQAHIMKICFIIGGVHLTIAHVWNAIVFYPDRKWIAQVGWIALVWCMFFAAQYFVLGLPFPAGILYLFLPGIAAIFLFMTSLAELKKEWIHHVMLPLTLINCFVDVISYIRLFAVGMASAKVAMSVNMAMNLGPSRIWTIPIIALILIAGHALNIILCALGILVHGVRLNTLEFSLHRQMQWSGHAYNPFSTGNQKTLT